MQRSMIPVLILSMACSAATAMEPITKEEVCSDLGVLMYKAAWEASRRADKDILVTRTYRYAVPAEDPEKKKVWGPYFAVAQQALQDGENAEFAALLTKTYCIKVN